MNFIALVAGAVAFAACLAGLVLFWRAKAYAVLTYLFALPVLQLAVLGFLTIGPRIIASAIGALVIAAPVAFMQRKVKARAAKTALAEVR